MSDARYEPTPELIEACAAQVGHIPDGVRQVYALATAIQHYASAGAAIATGDMRMADSEGTLAAAWAAVAQRVTVDVNIAGDVCKADAARVLAGVCVVGDVAVCEVGHE